MNAPNPSENPADTRLSWSAMTHTGRFRKSNEDAFLALTFDANEVTRLGKTGDSTLERGDFVFAVSDGMGGHNAGEFASRIAVEKITELFPRTFRLDAMGIRRGSGDLLDSLFSQIHEEIIRQGTFYEECRGMGATLSLCWFRPGWMRFCHVGDTRIYYLPREGPIKQITEDHTHVGWLLRQGKITAYEARTHPGRNQLSQAITAGTRRLDPQHGAVGFEPGDRFILCSDGLTDGLSDRGIEHILRSRPERVAHLEPAPALIHEGLAGSGRDNLTAIVIEALPAP